MNILKQKIRKDKRRFEIVDDGVIVDINNLGSIQNYKVNFDEIRKDEFINIKSADTIVWLFVFSAIFNVIFLTIILTEFGNISFENGKWIFLGLMSVIIIIFGTLKDHFQKVNIKTLESNKPLNFIYTKKTSNEVDNFISQIKEKQKTFLKNLYFKVDPIIPFEVQKSRILWLYETEIISEKEYRNILSELERKKVIEGE